MNLSVVFAKMAMLVLIMLLGYLCARIGITGPEFNQRVTPLVMNVLLTATILNSVLSVPDFTGRDIVDYVLVLTAATVLQIAVAWFLPRLLRTRSEDVGAARLVTAFGNVGFVGLPVVAAIFGDEMVFFASLANIPFNLALYSIGAAQLSGTAGARFDWRKVLNMPVIATLLSVVLLLSRIHVPTVIADTISTLAGATIPLSMLIIGTSLGTISVRAALADWRVYAVSAARLLVCPLLTWLVLRPFVGGAAARVPAADVAGAAAVCRRRAARHPGAARGVSVGHGRHGAVPAVRPVGCVRVQVHFSQHGSVRRDDPAADLAAVLTGSLRPFRRYRAPWLPCGKGGIAERRCRIPLPHIPDWRFPP